MNTLDAYAQTTLQAAQANALASVTAQVADLNAKTKAGYLTAFNNWLISWNAARITDRTTAPKPPNGYVVGYFNDPTTGPGSFGPYGDTVVQWAYPAIGTEPVAKQPPIPDVPPPQFHVVLSGNDRVMNVPAGDNTPVGTTIQAPDGSQWKRTETAGPFGAYEYYARVS